MGKKQKINNQKSNKNKKKYHKQHQKVKLKSQSNQKQYQLQDQQGFFQNMRQQINNHQKIDQIHIDNLNIFALKINEYYKLYNTQSIDDNCYLLNGIINNNGLNYDLHKKISVKGNSSIVVCPTNLIRIQNKEIISLLFSIQTLQNEKYEKVLNFLQTNQQNIIISCKTKIQVTVTTQPWKNLKVQSFLDGQKTIVIGLKNSGKSYFCEWILNNCLQKNKNICIIDTDLGKNRSIPGTISLTIMKNGQQEKINLWIGEITPLNNIQGYIKALKYVYNVYKQRYFTFSLLINTMGYITGIGQILLYEIFNIIKPKRVLSLNSNNIDNQCEKIQNNIQNGNYVYRLHITNLTDITKDLFKTTTNIIRYKNQNGQSKTSTTRFQPIITNQIIKNIQDLLMLIYNKKLQKLQKQITFLQQQKSGKIKSFQGDKNMRIIQLGYINGIEMLQVIVFGFGWQNEVYYDKKKYDKHIIQKVTTGVISQGIDFDKFFYQINQKNLITLQEFFDRQIPYIAPQVKALGNKGLRNTASKNIQNIQKNY